MTKIIATVLIVLIVWIQYHVWYGKKGKQELLLLESKISEQTEHNQSLDDRNQVLKREVFLLRNNPKILEEKAREKLGLIKKGEIFYRVIPGKSK